MAPTTHMYLNHYQSNMLFEPLAHGRVASLEWVYSCLLYTSLIDATKSKDMMESIMAPQGQSIHKALPVWSHMGNENWCMIGYHGVSDVYKRQVLH